MQRVLPLLLLSVAGCSSKSDIWLIEVDTTKGDGYSCAEQYATNFAGTLAEGATGTTGPVTETQQSIAPKILFYAKLVDLADGEATLNSGDLLLRGKEQGDNKWRFAWTAAESDIDTVVHEDGYGLETTYEQTYTTAIVLTFDGKTATGSMGVESVDFNGVREDDLWTEDAADDIGTTGTLGWAAADDFERNAFDTSECDGDDCTASITTTCAATAPLTAVRTQLTKQEDFASLVALEQYGSFKTTTTSSWGSDGDSGW